MRNISYIYLHFHRRHLVASLAATFSSGGTLCATNGQNFGGQKIMGQEVILKTGLTVHDLASFFGTIPDIKDLHEIDSINYGEGYDFKVQNIQCRIYYDQDNNDQTLIIEVDRHDNFTTEEQKNAVVLLKQIASLIADSVK